MHTIALIITKQAGIRMPGQRGRRQATVSGDYILYAIMRKDMKGGVV